MKYSDIRRLIDTCRLSEALDALDQQARQASNHEAQRQIDTLRDHYGYMLRYFAQGADDPGRSELYLGLVSRAGTILQTLERNDKATNSPWHYYNVLRTRQLMGLNGTAPQPGAADVREDLFDAIMTAYPLSDDDHKAVRKLLLGSDTTVAALAVSALYLGQMEYYDEERLMLLADAYALALSPVVQLRALVSLALAMLRWPMVPPSQRLRNRLLALPDSVLTFDADIRALQAELIRTIDTERVTRAFNDEVVPQIMNMAPDVLKRLRAMDLEDITANPEWSDAFAHGPLADSLRQMQEMQLEGSDVMMATFSRLKDFPFFRRLYRWLLPFSPHEAANQGLDKTLPPKILDTLARLTMMCDSDKYSLILSVGGMPEMQRQVMLEHLDEGATALAEIRDDDELPRQQLMGAYLHDLYRLYNVWPQHWQLYNPFIHDIDLRAIHIMEPSLTDTDTLTALAALSVKLQQYAIAEPYVRALIDGGQTSAQLYQQLGFCLQRQGRNDEAIKAYRRAETIEPEHVWTLRRLAQCYKDAGQHKQALAVYIHLQKLLPEDVGVVLNSGHCLLATGRYKEASKEYYQAEFLDEKGTRHLRPLAWCLMLLGKPGQAQYYYDQILQGSPTETDYLNAGHNALADHRPADALSLYRQSLQRRKGDKAMQSLLDDYDHDAPHMRQAGIDAMTISLMRDAIAHPDTPAQQ